MDYNKKFKISGGTLFIAGGKNRYSSSGGSSRPFKVSGLLPAVSGLRGLLLAFSKLLEFLPAFGASSGPFLGPWSFSGPFVGFWASSQPFWASEPLLNLF